MRSVAAAFFIFCAGMVSCDAPHSYEYQIANQCDTMIAVVIRRGADTTMFIPARITQTIFFESRIEKKRGGPKFRNIENDFDTIYVTKAGIPSRKNYMDNGQWVFTKRSDALGNTTASVTDADF